MTKDESLKVLADAKVDVTLTDKGEIRAGLLELAAKGALAPAEAEAYEGAIKTLNEQIVRLEKKKTPAHRKDLVTHNKTKKDYTLAQPKSFFRGKLITVKTLNQNQPLLTELLATKTSLLVEFKEEV